MESKLRLAVCPGSFDPVTNGHMDIIERAARMFDGVIVAVGVNPQKHSVFTDDERLGMLSRACASLSNVTVDKYGGLLADYAQHVGAIAIVKGLRALTDFDYEFQMALTNKKLNPELETVFIPASADHMFLSSSMVRQVAGFGGDISHFVPACILEQIQSRICSGGNANG